MTEKSDASHGAEPLEIEDENDSPAGEGVFMRSSHACHLGPSNVIPAQEGIPRRAIPAGTAEVENTIKPCYLCFDQPRAIAKG
jgi:hypothetical protein